MLESSNRDFEAAIINMLYETKWNTFESNRKVEVLRREIENINNLEILKLRNTIREMKTSLDDISSRVETTEEWSSELEDRWK